jgi:hypothetical protein
MVQDLGPLYVEPFAAGNPELQRQPVGDIDEILVHDRTAGHLGVGAVV